MPNSRVAALRRARQRQARIEAATARATKAEAALDRAMRARTLAAERHDERVRGAEEASAAEVRELVRVCGTADAAAEILGWTVRDVRKIVKADQERMPDAPERPVGRRGPRSEQMASLSDGGGNDADAGDD